MYAFALYGNLLNIRQYIFKTINQKWFKLDATDTLVQKAHEQPLILTAGNAVYGPHRKMAQCIIDHNRKQPTVHYGH